LEHKEYQSKVVELNAINATIQENPIIDNTELNSQKTDLNTEIEAIKTKLRNKVQNDAVDKRVSDLKIEQQNLASEIANVEKEFFIIEKFNKLKVESIESQVNERFKYVKFKLFKNLINQGTEEICECLVDGVNFSHANTAGKLNAGLDIISVLFNSSDSVSVFISASKFVFFTPKVLNADSAIITSLFFESNFD